jgi:hypothetical protein
VLWSDLQLEDFSPSYWNELYAWYEAGGYGHVAAYLRELDLSNFNPKAPPPKTEAFWGMVENGRAPEDADLLDILQLRGNPPAIAISEIMHYAESHALQLAEWLGERRNARQIPHRLEDAGYVRVFNSAATDKYWKVAGKREWIYVRKDIPISLRETAARELLRMYRDKEPVPERKKPEATS